VSKYTKAFIIISCIYGAALGPARHAILDERMWESPEAFGLTLAMVVVAVVGAHLTVKVWKRRERH
jgi:hypothetical protein